MINFKSIIKKNNGILIFVILCLICIISLIFADTKVCKSIKAGGHSFFSLFQLGMSEVQSVFSNSIKSIGELKSIKDENKRLKEQLIDYNKMKSEYVELNNELNKFRDLLDLKQSILSIYDSNIHQIAAQIIAKEPGNFYSTFILNRGKNDGVTDKMSVVALYKNFFGLVGKIVTVGNNTSIVMPIFNSSFYISARFQNSYYEGLINGAGENSSTLLMRYVQKQAKSEIKFGDLVISSGVGTNYPKDIHIGTVKEIRSKTYETSIEIEIEPVINFSKLEYVIILDNRAQNE